MKHRAVMTLLPLAVLLAAPCAEAQIRTVQGCKTRVAKSAKRSACMACITRPRPHQFFKKAPAGNRCRPYKMARAKVASTSAPTAIRTPAGCRAKVIKPGKRRACVACVKRPRQHGYFKRAKPGNRCKLLVQPKGIHGVKGCSLRVKKPGKRAACIACVTRPRKHVFFKAARAGNRCRRAGL